MDLRSRLLGFLPLGLFFIFMFPQISFCHGLPSNLIVIEEPTHKDKVDAFLEAKMQRHEIPGTVVAVVNGGEVIYENYMGIVNLETGIPVTQENIFRLYSLSKIFVTTGVSVNRTRRAES